MSGAERVYKVALFGVTGCGKSSIINLLADNPVANVSTGVGTRRARWYPISLGERKFRLWDTMGFNADAEAKGIDRLSPYQQAHALLRNLQDGVDLILLCTRKDGVNASLGSLYWLLDSFFFGGQAQIALVFTHFDTPDDQWWARNRNDIAQNCGIPVQSLPYACITTVQNGSPQSDTIHDQSKQVLKALLGDHATASIPTPLCLDLSSAIARAKAIESLNAYCKLNISDATTLVGKFKLPKRPFNVILFGEAGVGKSSIVNLIAGRPVAKISSDLESCTLKARSYEVNTGLHQFVVWDTVGFDATYHGRDMGAKAMETAARLIRELCKRGGIDLLVFCKNPNKPVPLEKSFKLFQECLCSSQIPVAFIITHLEDQDPMERWWETNGEGLLKAFNLETSAVVGHACVTALAPRHPDYQKYHDKLLLSKESILAMFEDSISFGTTFEDEGTRVTLFLKKLVGMVKVGNPPKITVENLMDRCGLTKEQAEVLIVLLYARC